MVGSPVRRSSSVSNRVMERTLPSAGLYRSRSPIPGQDLRKPDSRPPLDLLEPPNILRVPLPIAKSGSVQSGRSRRRSCQRSRRRDRRSPARQTLRRARRARRQADPVRVRPRRRSARKRVPTASRSAPSPPAQPRRGDPRGRRCVLRSRSTFSCSENRRQAATFSRLDRDVVSERFELSGEAFGEAVGGFGG
jgi:hypothetical protein